MESSMLRRRQIARVLAPNQLPVRFQGSMAAVAIPPSLAPGPDGAANARRHQIGLVRSNVAVRMATLFRRRSEEHTSELQSLMRISYAVFCLKKKKNTKIHITQTLRISYNHMTDNYTH